MSPITSKRIKRLVVFFGVIVIISFSSMFAINAAFSFTDEIYSGVKVGDIDVGGLSVVAAEEKIKATFQQKVKDSAITLIYKDKKGPVSASDLGLSINAKSLAQKAYEVGRTGNIIYQIQEKYLTINRGNVIPYGVNYNHEKIDNLIAEIAKLIDRDPQDAALSYINSQVVLSPELAGYKLDIDKNKEAITQQLNNSFPATITLLVSETQPEIKLKDLEGIDGLIASYSTQFNPGDQNRTQNITLAAGNIDGILIKKGEDFSFNKFVGPRLAEYGYKIAPVFINGKLVPGWGGGVCQVSSTLYNTALLADLTIVERTPHCRPPGYVPLGQDATVADGQLDFKFKNTSNSNIYISTKVYGNQLKVSIFGKVDPNMPEIQIVSADRKEFEPNTIVRQDPNLEFGREVVEVEGAKGFQISTYRVKYIDGKEINREFLAKDDFISVDRVIRVGTKKFPKDK